MPHSRVLLRQTLAQATESIKLKAKKHNMQKDTGLITNSIDNHSHVSLTQSKLLIVSSLVQFRNPLCSVVKTTNGAESPHYLKLNNVNTDG